MPLLLPLLHNSLLFGFLHSLSLLLTDIQQIQLLLQNPSPISKFSLPSLLPITQVYTSIHRSRVASQVQALFIVVPPDSLGTEQTNEALLTNSVTAWASLIPQTALFGSSQFLEAVNDLSLKCFCVGT